LRELKLMTCSGHRNISILVYNPAQCCGISEYLFM
jgi:hypothetical protein